MNQSATPTELPLLQEHPFYIEGIAQLNAGQWARAAESFQLLQGLYPDDSELKELLDEAHMRATMSRFQPKQQSKSHKRAGARWLSIGLLAVVSIALAGYVAYEFWINPLILQELRLRHITELRNTADEAIAAGDYTLARQTLQELQTILPEDPETIQMLRRVEQVEKLSQLYNEAKALMAENRWDEAVATLTELQQLDAHYRDLPQLLQTAQEAQGLDRQFQAAEAVYAQGDWPAALTQYQALQETNLTFRFDEIQERLFTCHLKYGQTLLAEASSNADQVSEAINHFAEALKLRPLESEAINERRLAENYLAVLRTTDRNQGIELLQAICKEQPGYAGQAAVQLLYTNLLERADAFLKAGDTGAASADYQAAAQLPVKDPSAAQQKLAELNKK